MIRILQHFIQHCNDNKNNMKLLSFMKEFINIFYEKKKSKYLEIFRECKNVRNSKIYCHLYTTCKGKFEKDLNLIEKNSDSYVKEQEEYINNLSEIDLWIIKAKAMFQDSEAMSRILPTIMSTITAILFFAFFLYKVLINYIFMNLDTYKIMIKIFIIKIYLDIFILIFPFFYLLLDCST
ncbi:hypothetical protein PVMG_00010 [Plasmodium vivax Mauritania I]|uniref:Variable surface protein n=1 Tax=Plasmodium vivax Mauritania I TaxID=1035515 RepID=A0A0J9T818_PLAVI|nr:hypothetical protein PVMG_00010 [Plasmodium vivax Mauritania I]